MRRVVVCWFSLFLMLVLSACGREKSTSSIQTPEIRTTIIDGREVTYEVIDGRAIFEGDIILGTVDALESEISAQATGFLDGSNKRLWPGGIIPYVIDAGVNATTVQGAIADWQVKTPIRFVKRTTQAGYVRFKKGTDPNACFSDLGYYGGEQWIVTLPSGDCGVRTMIHEIGHTVGFWHEQARCDRDNHVTILWNNINPTYKYAFYKNCEAQAVNTTGDDGQRNYGDGVDIGSYDLNSIMHYLPYAFTISGSPTIQSKSGATVGSITNRLTQRDANAVWLRYGYLPPCTSCKLDYTGTSEAPFRLPESGRNLKIWLEGPKNSSDNWNLWLWSNATPGKWSTLGRSQNLGSFEYISVNSWSESFPFFPYGSSLNLSVQKVGSTSGSYRLRFTYD